MNSSHCISISFTLTAWYRTGPDSSLPMPETVPTKPYDWTYTTTHPGTALPAENSDFNWKPADPENQAHSIPMAELRRPDPIMFYSEIPLFEDELHDNGSSNLLVRIVSSHYIPLKT